MGRCKNAPVRRSGARRAWLLFSSVALVSAWSWRVLAQPTTSPAGSAPDAPEAARATRGKVVVVADVFDDATKNAKLRAEAYELLRARGYQPDPKVDVDESARNSSAMENGKIVAKPGLLGPLRSALGATLLVRVSAEWRKGDILGVRVSLITDEPPRTQVVEAPAADPAARVRATLEVLLDESSGKSGAVAGGAAAGASAAATPPDGASPASGGEQPGRVVGLITEGAEPPPDEPDLTDPKVARAAWEERGGMRASYEVRGIATGLYAPKVPFSDEHPITGATETGTAEQFGVGGGVGLFLSLFYAKLPDPTLDSGGWVGFDVGVGGMASVLYSRPPIGYTYKGTGTSVATRETRRENQALLYVTAPGVIGIHFGIGRYRNLQLWRGVVLGFAYAPALVYSMQIGSTSGGHAYLDYAGFQASLDLATPDAAPGKSANQLQPRLSAMLQPRIEKNGPWLLSLGFGAAWY